MKESTELGQDKQKITNMTYEFHRIIEKYYPGEDWTGLELFEVLDALALFTVYVVTGCNSPKMTATAKKYFSQRLVEFSERAPQE